MRTFLNLTAAALLGLAAAAPSQNVQVFGEPHTRGATTQILFGDGIMAGISIEHGTPAWKDEYNGMLDHLKGRLLRLGSNWWTTMTTSVDLEFGGQKVPAGAYLLGLHCDEDGKFAMTFLEATKGLKAGALPFATSEDRKSMNWKPDFMAPLKLMKDASDEVAEEMHMELKINPDLKGTYTLSWGKHQLVADVHVMTKGMAKKGG
ncbi:MAG: DUF2911 domain-containing protein [Planctomycetes bacterium]|nr:DUF2911 domain-containing protein [Planctomycetota bacterium]